MILASGAVVIAFVAFLLGLAVLIFIRQPVAERFLLAFASSVRAHYLEQSLRLMVGGALVVYSPYMRWPRVFQLFGWVIVFTTIGLLCIPWRWHRRFAEWAVPPVIRFIGLFGVTAAALGVLVLYSVFFNVVTP